MDRIVGMKEELSRLLKERPALEAERRQVFAVIDSAPHMTPDLREQVHDLYDKDLARVQADITGICKRLEEIEGDSK